MMDAASNPFDLYAEAATPGWAKRKDRVAAIRARSKAEKQVDEDEILERLYLRGERERRAALLAGPYGKDVKGVIAFLRTMTPSSAPALIRLVENAAWLTEAPTDVRFAFLKIVSAGIAKLRQAEGLDPFDDALPDEPPTAFQVIRERLEIR